MSVLRTNVDFAKRIFNERVGNDYVYGGVWDPDDPDVGTDCSGLVVAILDACVNGPRMTWSRHGMTTESWRPIEVGQVGPFGTITVASPADFPPDAAVKVALHHGPGGGAASHMWAECDGVRMESNGSDGCVTGNQAMSVYDTSYANDWAYLPGPIVDAGGQPAPLSKRDQYALAIIGEGQRRGITPRGIQIALATALVESNLTMYANSSVPESLALPHEAVGSDHDSVGLFQQRCPMWGPAPVLMDPAKSAGLFYDRLVNLNYNGSNSPGWYAQAVQRSAFPDRYDQRFADAVALYDRLAGTDEGDDFMGALTDAEQREMLDLLRQQSGYRRVSRSPLRHVGEGPTETATGFELNMDGSVHTLLVQSLAKLGDPDALALLHEVANMDPARYPDRVHDKQLAQAILNDIARQATPGSAPPSGQTPGVIPTPELIPTPPPQPVTVPPAPVAVPPVAPTVPPSGGGVTSAVNGIDNDVAALRQVLADLTNQIRS